VNTLDLSWTKVEDVSALGRVHFLNISNTRVKDISALGQVREIRFSYITITGDQVHAFNPSPIPKSRSD